MSLCWAKSPEERPDFSTVNDTFSKILGFDPESQVYEDILPIEQFLNYLELKLVTKSNKLLISSSLFLNFTQYKIDVLYYPCANPLSMKLKNTE